MHAIAESFKSAGALFYLMLTIGAASVTLSAVGLGVGFSSRSPRFTPIFSVLAFAASLGIAHLAYLQRTTALWAIKRSIPVVPVDQKHLLALRGVSEIAPVMFVALVLLAVPWMTGALLAARGALVQPEPRSRRVGFTIAGVTLLGVASFAFGLERYAVALGAFQDCGARAAALIQGPATPPAAAVSGGTILAATWNLTALLVIAALLTMAAALQRPSRLTAVTTAITFVIGLAFAATGHAFAIDFDKEFGRAGGRPLIDARPGLELPTTASHATPSAVGLVEIAQDAIFVDGVKVAPGKPLVAALKQAPVLELNSSVMPLLADRRATFAQLAHVLDAAELAGHHRFELIAEPRPAYRAVRFRDPSTTVPSTDNRPVLGLTVRVTTSGFLISGNGGNLEPMPLDFAALNQKLAEIRVSFPEERSVTLAPAGAVSIESLVKTCDAVSSKGNQLLFDDVVISFPREE